VYFDGPISALSVEDRTASYAWEEWDASANLNPLWHSDVTIGPCKVWRNKYAVMIDMCLRRDRDTSGTYPENMWDFVIANGVLPVGWRPGFDLWSTVYSVEQRRTGSMFEIRVTNSGSVQVNMLGSTTDWQEHTRVPVCITYPRSDA